MKIGILTFHWATNYGAILQAYALQKYLEDIGHDVTIINYFPKNQEISIARSFQNIKHLVKLFRNPHTWFKTYQKERSLQKFRNKYLNLSTRCYSSDDIKSIINDMNVLISGSDQVLNASFTLYGDEGRPCSIYYLDFKGLFRRVGYAVSFGCQNYPQEAYPFAEKWIQNFNSIGVRESSGLNILSDFKFRGCSEIVPDPTILYYDKLFKSFNIKQVKQNYVYVYMLHGSTVDKLNSISSNIVNENVNPQNSLIKWIETIACADSVITNSYHGTIVAILNHVPFVAILQQTSGSGMNDRFFTLLSRLGLQNRIANNDYESIINVLNNHIYWDGVDRNVKEFRDEGLVFLNKALL